MITVENFSKKYNLRNKDYSVKNVSLSVADGQIAALLGPNGSGKSTLIKAVCGFHYPTEGIITLSDLQGNSLKITPEFQECNPMKICGYVPEKSSLPQNMYVFNFLLEKASCHSDIDDKKKAVSDVIKKFSLESVISKKINSLSKGFQQRVSFAQALIHNPSNLILDEPFSGLDPAQSAKVCNLIKELSKNKAVLISTHNFSEIKSLCSKIYILNKGEVAASGTEADILTKTGADSLENAFISLTEGTENQEGLL